MMGLETSRWEAADHLDSKEAILAYLEAVFEDGDTVLIVSGALMIEPTESEPKEELDAFCEAMIAIARESQERPELVRSAPHTTPVRRLDEARAARQPVLRWRR